MGLDPTTTEQLLALEVQIEHEQVIPIVENLALVRDGDLLVSDTYLPRAIVQSLSERAGLERQVGLVVTNSGKHSGTIWPQLKRSAEIQGHFGDNLHSDSKTRTACGIPSVIYVGAGRTPVEQLLNCGGWVALREFSSSIHPVSTEEQFQLWFATSSSSSFVLVNSTVPRDRIL